ncbi:MAG: SAM-dependent methyltransferase [Burkholderiaceae bacterium]|jgi:16S rRNA (cytidine1402-2'-O)-methyltransferase|nr:SAM-dependent methyltransferase [Burkholderiaceae bacterium]
MKTGILYLIPSPLGTREEYPDPLAHIIPDEVRKITAGLTCFIVENAKTARAYLKQVGRTHPLALPIQQIRMMELNTRTKTDALPALLAPLLAGKDCGLISEAGVPAVADPGANLVEAAHREGITVKPLVGPSSILLALMASGLNGQCFAFCGYLPTHATQRAKEIRLLEERSRQIRQTQIFIETPYRNHALLDALCTHCHDSTRLCVATNLTLPDESICTRDIAAWREKKGETNLLHRKPSLFLLLAR